MAVDYGNHGDVLTLLASAQSEDEDIRSNARECNTALNKRDGQWEPHIVNVMVGRPRYTFDKLNPIVDAICGQISKNDYDIMIKPAGGGANDQVALTYDGIIRNIENISDATRIYKMAARKMVTCGIGGWRIIQAYADTDSFDQDLKIAPLSNFEDRVWFGPHELPTAEDAPYCWVLTALSKEDYDAQFPEGSRSSLPQQYCGEWWQQEEKIIVGEFYCKKPVTRELVKMSDGSVYTVDESFQSVVDELAEQGITEVARRKRKTHKITVRKMDGGGWLSKEKDTVFNLLPVCRAVANFQVTENKAIWWGAIDKLLDQQRVYNYARSRQIEEGALAPREKFFMTKEQAKGHDNQLRRMNTSPDPVQFYNHVDGTPPPYKSPPPSVNPSLEVVAAAASEDINASAGLFSANLGDNPGLQSGEAIGMQIDKGDDSNLKYVEALSEAIRYTARVLIGAIPRVYEPGRQARLVNQDGTYEQAIIGEEVIDRQTLKPVVLNDLTQGVYDVVVEATKSFKTRQEQTSRALMEIGAIDPSVIELGGDVLLRNIPAPGMDDVAARKRAQLINAGMIPMDQMTDEEREAEAIKQQQAANQPPDPATLIAQAEIENAQARAAEVQSKTMERAINAKLKQQEMLMKQQDMEVNQELAAYRAQMEFNQQIADNLKTMAETLNAIKQAMGADVVVSQDAAGAYQKTAGMLEDATSAASGYVGENIPN